MGLYFLPPSGRELACMLTAMSRSLQSQGSAMTSKERRSLHIPANQSVLGEAGSPETPPTNRPELEKEGRKEGQLNDEGCEHQAEVPRTGLVGDL